MHGLTKRESGNALWKRFLPVLQGSKKTNTIASVLKESGTCRTEKVTRDGILYIRKLFFLEAILVFLEFLVVRFLDLFHSTAFMQNFF